MLKHSRRRVYDDEGIFISNEKDSAGGFKTMSRRARVRGIEIAYDVAGEEGGGGVVLVHGFPFNRSMWGAQVEALRETHRVITLDLRGHGGSEVVAGAATMEESAQDIASLLDELNIKSASVAGLSMGGYVALAFYRMFPDRVRSLVLADTRAQADTDEARRTREETAARALEEGMGAIADSMLPKLFAPATFEQNPEVVARVREMILSTKPEGAAAALRGMAARRDQTEFLKEIKVPVLILVGGEDAITPPADSRMMRSEIEGSRLEIIEGAGHVSNLERPAEFNRALVSFLRDVPGAGGEDAA